ncbi:MAG: hypothetical protein ACJAZK_000543 [Psychroserpens sp.]|jgi:hypothetical protein
MLKHECLQSVIIKHKKGCPLQTTFFMLKNYTTLIILNSLIIFRQRALMKLDFDL